MSIKPEFVSGIVTGSKRFEFRRRIFRRPVSVVVIYATAPIQQVIGEFDIKQVILDEPTKLWRKTRQASGIEKLRFFEYFSGCNHGYAIEIGDVRLYEEPLSLEHHFGIRPPQSFMYLDFSWPLYPQKKE